MPEEATSRPALLIPVRADADLAAAGKPLPAILQTATRGGAGAPDPFLANVVVEQSYPLAAVGRGETARPEKIEDSRKLLALEAVDGTTVFIRTDRLQEELARLCPDAVGKDGIDLARFGDREATTRGGIGWPWSKLSVISLGKDAIIDTARDKALEWAKDWLGEKVQEAAEAGASWLGAKALMWAIESQLAGKPGLYQWNGGELAASDRRDKDDPRLVSAAKEGPWLIFIHGTGSHTLGGFKDLRATAAAAEWELLAGRFDERVFGFEHRTFSESPIDNALALAEAIPAGARLSLVTHSRGGLVGDLLCLGALDDALINAYRREAPVNEKETSWQKRVREKVAAEEQRKLRELRRLLDTKQFQIERYVRVAAPARGTALLSDNLEVFLSGFLSLTSSLVGALTGPAGSAVMSAFKRIVLEIADKRVDARLVPGIEAMLTDSPLGVVLAQAPRRQGVTMAVITGDMDGGGILKRLGVMFTDWMFFDRADNDLVVDTASMYAGLARSGETRYLYDQGASVNHFQLFRQPHHSHRAARLADGRHARGLAGVRFARGRARAHCHRCAREGARPRCHARHCGARQPSARDRAAGHHGIAPRAARSNARGRRWRPGVVRCPGPRCWRSGPDPFRRAGCARRIAVRNVLWPAVRSSGSEPRRDPLPL